MDSFYVVSVKYGEMEWVFGKRIVSLRVLVVLGIFLIIGFRSYDELMKEIKFKF